MKILSYFINILLEKIASEDVYYFFPKIDEREPWESIISVSMQIIPVGFNVQLEYESITLDDDHLIKVWDDSIFRILIRLKNPPNKWNS